MRKGYTQNPYIDKQFTDLTEVELRSMARGAKKIPLEMFLDHYSITGEEYIQKLQSLNMKFSRNERLVCKVPYQVKEATVSKNHNPFKLEEIKISRVEMTAIRLFRGYTIREMADRIGKSVELTANAEKYNSFCSDHMKSLYLKSLKITRTELTRIRLALSGKVNGIEIDRQVPKMIREEVYKLYDNCCGDCKSESNLHIHHKHKFSKGGKHERDNLELLCAACHAERHKNDREYHVLKSIAERVKAL